MFNLSLHATILFTILVSFFVFYVSKIEVDALQGELKSNIRNNLTKVLESNPAIGASLQDVPYDALKRAFSKPDPVGIVSNHCLFKSMFVMVGVLFLITFFIYLYYRNSIDVAYILKENAAIFLLVGVCEFAFFFFIASKYDPIPPSAIITSSIASLKANLGTKEVAAAESH